LLSPIINGIITGVLLGLFSYGAVFFMLLKVGMQQGFRKGALFEAGHILSILMVIAVIQFSLVKVEQIAVFKQVFSLLGGLVVLGFGLNSLRSARVTSLNGAVRHYSWYRLIIEGFALNIINPFEFIIWLGLIGGINLNYKYDENQSLVFCTTALGAMAFVDLLKVLLARQIGKYLTEPKLVIINKIVGVIVMLIGVSLIVYFFVLFRQK
jgi:threonine/homoserine/homoserine lactone efflux protein